ncbi:hypothetical protein VST7929_00245 [Vibrio stylophorae]|uniref:Fe3+-hydroxamate ABC transporter substrate-binding protein n=1 Tax=Vibrio stylophorae TaxID=659351 RepID=A0ABN8DMS2_9VIBR|nr:TIGR04219 family outer membrane beta-barrel protein [Vibrio stylophorae]CAH0532416.1 hypothetical protein VST7929_00245 [Vibrio stylophorae]
MKKLMTSAVALAVTSALAMPAQAAMLLGAKAGVYGWVAETDVTPVGGAELNGGDDVAKGAYVAIEHFIPLIPNVKLRYHNYEADRFEMTQTDMIAYYEILDNDALAFDIGVNFSNYDGIDRTAGGKAFDSWTPSIYSEAIIGLPATPLSLYGEMNFGSFDGTSTFDGQFGLFYTLPIPAIDVNLKAGYRVIDNDFDNFDGYSREFNQEGFIFGAEIVM